MAYNGFLPDGCGDQPQVQIRISIAPLHHSWVSVRPSAGGAGHNRCESVGAYDIYRR